MRKGGAVIVAEFAQLESGRKNERSQIAAAKAHAEKAVIAVAKIDRLARDAGFVLKLANEVEKNEEGWSRFFATCRILMPPPVLV